MTTNDFYSLEYQERFYITFRPVEKKYGVCWKAWPWNNSRLSYEDAKRLHDKLTKEFIGFEFSIRLDQVQILW